MLYLAPIKREKNPFPIECSSELLDPYPIRASIRGARLASRLSKHASLLFDNYDYLPKQKQNRIRCGLRVQAAVLAGRRSLLVLR